MYIVKNAIKNIWRNKGRNILMGVIVFGIIVSTVVAFSINSTTSSIIEDYKSRFGSEVNILLNFDKINQQEGPINFEMKNITTEQYISFAKSKYIKDSYFRTELPSNSESLKAVDEDAMDSSNRFSMSTSIGGGEEPIEIPMPTLKLLGNSNVDNLEEFKKGERKIIEGKMYKEKNEAIISKELAELNNIKIGDEIEIKNIMDREGKNIKLKVSGIYEDFTDEYGNIPFKDSFMNRRNEILTSFDTCSSFEDDNGMSVIAKYYLKNPDMIKDFEEEIRSKGLPEMYRVSTDEATYNNIVAPVEGLISVTNMFVIVVIILGSIILILLNSINIRERKYEIGVLRAMGMKKSKVVFGFITESMLITSICLLLGIGAGAALAQPVSDILLNKQIEIQQENQNNMTQGIGGSMSTSSGAISIGGPSLGNEESISNIDVKLSKEAVLKVVGVSMILVFVSSIVGVSYITKYEPIKILTERG